MPRSTGLFRGYFGWLKRALGARAVGESIHLRAELLDTTKKYLGSEQSIEEFETAVAGLLPKLKDSNDRATVALGTALFKLMSVRSDRQLPEPEFRDAVRALFLRYCDAPW
jgi:hypothetical protein